MKAIQSLFFVLREGGSWLLLGHVITLLGQFLLLKIIAVYGSSQMFGQFAIVLLIFSALQILLYGPVTQWAIRHYQEFAERNRLGDYYTVVRILSMVLLFLSVLISIFISVFFGGATIVKNLGLSSNLILLSVLFGVIACLNDLMSSIFNASSHSFKAAIFFALGTWLRVFSVIISIQLGQISLGQIVFWMIVLQLLLLIIQYWMLIRVESTNRKKISKRRHIFVHLHRMKNYSLPFMLWGIPAYVALMGDRWVLAQYVDASTLGIYAAMIVSTLGVANAVGVAMNKAIVPLVFKISGAGHKADRRNMASKMINNLSLILFVTYLPLILVYYLWPSEVISLFTSSEFSQYSEYLWILMVGAIAFNLSQFLITHGLVEKSPRIYVPIKYLHGILAISLLLFLVPSYGVAGAVVAVVISHVLQLGLVILVNVLVINKRNCLDVAG